MPLTVGILPSGGHSSLYTRLPQKPRPALLAMGTTSLDFSNHTPLWRAWASELTLDVGQFAGARSAEFHLETALLSLEHLPPPGLGIL